VLAARGLSPGERIAVPSKSWLIPLLVSLALGATATALRADPMAGARMANEAANQRDARLERVAARHCWLQQGRRHCRDRTSARQTSDYYVRDADKLPYGTSRWWEEMLRENRAGNPGGGGRN
jgi:hypothetical protein